VRASIATGATGAVVVVALAFSSGGYFASDWGVLALASILVVVAALVLIDAIEIGRRGLLFLAALGAFGLWQLVSVLWSDSAELPVLEAERTLVYLCAAAALLVALRPATVSALFEGIVAGVVVVTLYALGTRLAPGHLGGAYDPSSGYQLAKPIGYWNALGLLVAFALVIAAAEILEGDVVRSALAGACAVPLAACLYFTFSRGSLAALAVGLMVVVALAGDRILAAIKLTLLLAVPLGGVLLASRSPALTAAGATLQTAQQQGARLAWQLGLLAAVAAVVQAAATHLLPRWTPGRSLRRMLAAGAAVLVLVLLVGALAAGGGPVALAERAKAAFVEDPPVTERSLDRRMLSVSGNGRAAYWRVAARMVRREPLHGAGAGSFVRVWTKERPIANEARDAHNLYLETLAELGPLGLTLILAVLIVPFTVVPAARREPGATAAAGVLATFAVHAAVDWDWEIPLLTLVAVAAAAALLVLDPGRRLVALGSVRRTALLAVAAVCLAAALVVHVGNRSAASALDAIAADRPREAATAAERARTWIPWSSQGDRLLGEARAEAGADAAARVALRRAIRRDPGDWSAWYDLATVSNGLERVNAVTRARDLNPLSVEVAGLAAEE